MKRTGLFWAGLMMAGILTLAGCGGGGGGSASSDGGSGQPTVKATTFNMVELAGFGGDFSAGVAINDAGLAVGFSHNGTSIKGAKWTVTDAAPAATVLDPLAGNSYSAAYSVSASGIAVGESGENTDANTVAVFWPAGSSTPTALSTVGLFAGGASAAFAINSAGAIAGEAVVDAVGNTVAVYWSDSGSAPVELGNLPGGDFSSAYSIGADGRIVGEAGNNAGQNQAVVWLPAVVGFQAPIALAAVPDQLGSVALGVDKNGRIVGEVELASGVIQGVIWNAAGNVVAANFGDHTSAQAINDLNRVAGYSAALSGSDRAAMWSGGNIADTKNLANNFSQAYGLNASNQVVGTAGSQGFVAIPQ